MLVVADTSPLSYLIRLGCVDVLRDAYGRVLIPHAVFLELLHPEAPKEVQAWIRPHLEWIEVVKVPRPDAALPAKLGAGEREAISLAVQIGADILLIDERAGREEAEARGLVVAGTLAVLLQASVRGGLDFPEALGLLQQYGFRVAQPLAKTMLDRYHRAKSADKNQSQ